MSSKVLIRIKSRDELIEVFKKQGTWSGNNSGHLKNLLNYCGKIKEAIKEKNDWNSGYHYAIECDFGYLYWNKDWVDEVPTLNMKEIDV